MGKIYSFQKSKYFSNKNKKKGNEGPAQPQKKEKYNNGFFDLDKYNKPYFPSTLLINEGFGEPGYGLSFRNYSRLRQRNGNIGTLNYLEKDGVTIIKDMAPTTDNSQFTDVDNTKGVSDYYAQVLYNNTPQTRNSGNVIVSANMIQNNYLPANALQFVLPNNSGTYITDIKDYKIENALDNKVQNYSRFVDKDGNAFVSFGSRSIRGEYSDNDISKLASLNLRYGTNTTNLLTIKTAKPDDKLKWDSIGDNGNLASDSKLVKTIWNWVVSQKDLKWGAEFGAKSGSNPSAGVVKGRGITEFHHFELKTEYIKQYWDPWSKHLSDLGFSATNLDSTSKLQKLYEKLLA